MSEIPSEENIKRPESPKDAFFQAYGLPMDPEHMEQLDEDPLFKGKRKLALFKAVLPNGAEKYYFSSGGGTHIDLAYSLYQLLVRDKVIPAEESSSFEALLEKYGKGEKIAFQFALGFLKEPDGFTVRESSIPEVTVTE